MQDRTASRHDPLCDLSTESADRALTFSSGNCFDTPQTVLSPASFVSCSTSSFIKSSPPLNDLKGPTPRQQPSLQISCISPSPDSNSSCTLQHPSASSSPVTLDDSASSCRSAASPQPGYTCGLCPPRVLYNVDLLIDHIRVQHKLENPSPSKPYHCICRKKPQFKERREFRRHIESTPEHGALGYRCRCGNTFYHKYKFRKHVQGGCTGNLPYQCKCGPVSGDIPEHLNLCGKKRRGRPRKMKEDPKHDPGKDTHCVRW
jgi:hypothetical protein